MIIDTTYILPLAGIGVKHDLLRAIAESKVKGITLRDLKISLISLFEMQAKAAKLGVPPERVFRAARAIMKGLTVIPFYNKEIIRKAHELRKTINDYIDCTIVATAITLKEDLATEDRLIHEHAAIIEKEHGIKIKNYKQLINKT